MIFPLDGPAVYKAISVTDTAQEVKVGANPLEERKVITIQPTDGIVYYGYSNSVTAANGTKIYKNQWLQLEAADTLLIYLIADTGVTVDVRITEVS